MAANVLAANQVTVPAGGTAQLVFGPGPAFQRWEVSRVSIVAAGMAAGDEPACVITKGSVNGYQLASTDAGSSDDADFPELVELYPGDFITVRWTGATVGGKCSATVWGISGQVGS